MSVTISDCNQICKSPLNTSPSKMLFTFPKQNRFSKNKQILCDKYYQTKNLSHLRTTSFGFGDKYDFTRDASCSPPSNTYVLQDDFKKNIKKGFGFGKGRQQMQVTGPFVSVKKNKIPGPGSYQLPSMLQKSSFNFRSKLNTFDHSKKNVPGPGTYPVPFVINQKGKYFLARYKNSCVRDFGKILGRCQTSHQNLPGPGSYKTHGVDLSPKGKYVSSKLHNCLVRSFVGSERKFLGQKTNNPGPGNYRLPSEFGYYESGKKLLKRQFRVRQQNVSTSDGKQNLMTIDNSQTTKKGLEA